MTCIFEAINERILGVTLVLTHVLSNSNVYQQWLAQTRHNWLPACPVSDLSSQASNSLLGSSVDTLSASESLQIESAMNINSDLQIPQQTVNISSQNLQSPNIDSSSSMDLSLIINKRVGGYTVNLHEGLSGTEVRTLTIPHHRTPSDDLFDTVT